MKWNRPMTNRVIFFLGIRATNYTGQIVGHFDWQSVEEPTDMKFKTLTMYKMKFSSSDFPGNFNTSFKRTSNYIYR